MLARSFSGCTRGLDPVFRTSTASRTAWAVWAAWTAWRLTGRSDGAHTFQSSRRSNIGGLGQGSEKTPWSPSRRAQHRVLCPLSRGEVEVKSRGSREEVQREAKRRRNLADGLLPSRRLHLLASALLSQALDQVLTTVPRLFFCGPGWP